MMELIRTDRRAPANAVIADALERLGTALEERGANPHRIQAYLRAADTVRQHDRPLAEMLKEGGPEALETLPGIGQSIASRIAGYVESGRLQLLERLRNEFTPEDVFTRVPGIGRVMARRIHEELGIESLEALEVAAHDGRLARVEGFGSGRVRAVRLQLQALLGNRARQRSLRFDDPGAGARQDRAPRRRPQMPPVGLLLEVDRRYREAAEAGALRRIAPRRFNPDGEAWLPILTTTLDGWRFTALFSNTARAHHLGRTHDWVVLYARREGETEQSWTVVTERRGDLAGRRVVRGHEAACRAFYAEADAPQRLAA